jgi:hypothetical protein
VYQVLVCGLYVLGQTQRLNAQECLLDLDLRHQRLPQKLERRALLHRREQRWQWHEHVLLPHLLLLLFSRLEVPVHFFPATIAITFCSDLTTAESRLLHAWT